MSELLDDIISEMISLHRDVESKELVKKFAYDIHQLLEVSNVFYRIMYNPDSEKNKNAATHEHPLNTIIIKYPNRIIQISQELFEESIYEIKLRHNSEMSAANLLGQAENA